MKRTQNDAQVVLLVLMTFDRGLIASGQVRGHTQKSLLSHLLLSYLLDFYEIFPECSPSSLVGPNDF